MDLGGGGGGGPPGGCHVMDLGLVRRMSCDGFGGGGSGRCHVMDFWRMSCDGQEVETEDADWI